MKGAKYLVLVLVLFQLVNCSNQNNASTAGTTTTNNDFPSLKIGEKLYKGMYWSDRRTSKFINCEDQKPYVLIDPSRTIKLDSLYKLALGPGAILQEKVYIEVYGAADTIGYPNGSKSDAILISRVGTVTGKNLFNCCIPYEFWCVGAEPFWSVQVSENEKGIYYKNADLPAGYRFPYAPVEEKDGKWTCKTEVGTTGGPLTLELTITKTPYTDQYKRVYPYTVELKTGGKTYTGGAAKWGELPVENK